MGNGLGKAQIDKIPAGHSATIKITVYENGALAVEGPIHEKAWMLAVLENAKDAVKNYRGGNSLVIPGKDVSLP